MKLDWVELNWVTTYLDLSHGRRVEGFFYLERNGMEWSGVEWSGVYVV